MSYQVLARRFRPQTFAEVVGQGHVVRALANALDQQRLHHAYLLTGTRGVGKTTLARIFAKALNCEKGVSSTPCGVCGACVEIAAGRFADFIELDAASHTGIDNMREIMDNAQYVPTAGRFKIYLIDEVHMLSKAAFNSILKTLEEPPAHVKFILATTDPQKIPVTVLSRCLQFNLKQMGVAEIEGQMRTILEGERIAADRGALQLIARHAEGSMRDALSLLDQGIAYGGGQLDEATLRAMLAVVDSSYLFNLLDAVAAADAAAVMREVERIVARSVDFEAALQELASLLHRIALAQTAPDAISGEPEAGRIAALAQKIAPEQVQLYYQIALNGRRDFAVAPDTYAGFTMPLLRMLAFTPKDELAPLTVRRPSEASQTPLSRQPDRPAADTTVAAAKEASPANSVPPSRVSPDAAAAPAFDGNWLAVVAQLKAGGMARMLAEHCEVQRFDTAAIEFCVPPEHKHLLERAYQDKLKSELKQLFGANLRVSFAIGSIDGLTPARVAENDRQARLAKAKAAIEEDPFVQGVISGLDAKVIESSIKPIDQ